MLKLFNIFKKKEEEKVSEKDILKEMILKKMREYDKISFNDIKDFFKDFYNINYECTLEELIEELKHKRIKKTIKQDLLSLLEKINFFQYTADNKEEKVVIFTDIENIIEKL